MRLNRKIKQDKVKTVTNPVVINADQLTILSGAMDKVSNLIHNSSHTQLRSETKGQSIF